MTRRIGVAAALGLCAVLLGGCGDSSATADPTSDPTGDPTGDPTVAQTYALPDADWCDQLDLTATADTLGVTLESLPDYPVPPELTGDLGLQCVYGGGSRAAAGAVPDAVPDGGQDTGAGPAITVVVDLLLIPAGSAPDLERARAFYAAPGAGTLDVSSGDVTGWWDDGAQGTATLGLPGEEEATGYRCGTTVADDNLTVDVSISADPLPDALDNAAVDTARDQLLDAVHDRLTLA